MVIIILFVVVVALLSILTGDKLDRRLEEIDLDWKTPKKKLIREIFFDENGIQVIKEGDNLIIDIYPYNLHRKFFIPGIAETEINGLIEAIKKVDSVSIEKK